MKYNEINRELSRNTRGIKMTNVALSNLTKILRNYIIIDIEGMEEENIIVDNTTDGVVLMIDGHKKCGHKFKADYPTGISIVALIHLIEESPNHKINVSKIIEECYL